jgi:hypothetical protein
MVINLEHVKARRRAADAAQRAAQSMTPLVLAACARCAAPRQMLVTAEEALIPNSDLPEVSAFAEALSKRLKQGTGIVHARSVDVRGRVAAPAP